MPLITITQSIGCDGLAVAKRVAEGLNIELFDDVKLKEEAAQKGLLLNVQEKLPGWFARLMGDQPELYRELIEAVVFGVASRGQGIIVGHGSQVLLQDFACAMHVLISGSAEWRIKNMMREFSLSREDASSVMVRSDRQNRSFFRYAFQKEWDDPSLYDLSINPEKVGTKRAAETIIQMARYPELRKCSIYAIEALDRFSLARRVKVHLIERGVRPLGLSVEVPSKGVVHVTGVIHQADDKQLIEDVTKAAPGVVQVQVDVTLVPAGYVS